MQDNGTFEHDYEEKKKKKRQKKETHVSLDNFTEDDE